jgi:aspartyl/asparaginyl-tRNA synthetase
MTRKEIAELVEVKQSLIRQLRDEIIQLNIESVLLSDDEQWFTEKMETVTYRENRKKVKKEQMVGRINWKEDFKDEDTDEVITIERSQVVRVDGEWV